MTRPGPDAQHTYPHGVPCWIEGVHPDPEAGARFYADLLGWEWVDQLPPEVPGHYLVASLDGRDAAAFSDAPAGTDVAGWVTYVAVDDLPAATDAARGAGARVLQGPFEVGPAGSMSEIEDPVGASIRLWSPARRIGAQVTNAPGAWNVSDLHTDRPAAARDFYAATLGWGVLELGEGVAPAFTVRGYGDHLEATVRPDIHAVQSAVGAPEGFADVVAGLGPLAPSESHSSWHVTFTVADRDASAARATELGAEVLATDDGTWARTARLRDPQGAELTISQFTPPGEGER